MNLRLTLEFRLQLLMLGVMLGLGTGWDGLVLVTKRSSCFRTWLLVNGLVTTVRFADRVGSGELLTIGTGLKELQKVGLDIDNRHYNYLYAYT